MCIRDRHSLVHALDHVRAVQDQGLVALAGQAAVVLRGQVELLERRAHAAVADDYLLTYGLEIVSLAHTRYRLTRRPWMSPLPGSAGAPRRAWRVAARGRRRGPVAALAGRLGCRDLGCLPRNPPAPLHRLRRLRPPESGRLPRGTGGRAPRLSALHGSCLLYTSDAAD